MESETQETEYVSQSTIDREPRPPKDDEKQQKIFDEEEHESKVQEYMANHGPDQVAYKLTLKIDGNGFSNTIAFGAEKIPADQFEEMILKRMQGEYFLQQIRGICGEQRPPQVKQEELGFSNPLTRETEEGTEAENGIEAAKVGQEAAETTQDSQTAEPAKEKPAKRKFKALKQSPHEQLPEEPAVEKANLDKDDPSTWL